MMTYLIHTMKYMYFGLIQQKDILVYDPLFYQLQINKSGHKQIADKKHRIRRPRGEQLSSIEAHVMLTVGLNCRIKYI